MFYRKLDNSMCFKLLSLGVYEMLIVLCCCYNFFIFDWNVAYFKHFEGVIIQTSKSVAKTGI